ncbi:coniferyl aldehyde dehydrogenase [Alcanivorax quisquiliarum]|uniref:Aldehyde dehydrogenase n=1 Tax=Alcanivorax quisquiliarum TaxID=2933565 RepID=A0ABT0E5I5_9GAMM|nr:coniferyl aldehyde dehydrogenase [Alcanivorax quisquiliarum]MCK0537003.1 coniferyl aldehyde dehydrogenase [Alcanivorax quisquiliarum]
MVAEVKSLHTHQEDVSQLRALFDAQRAAFFKQPYPTADERIEHLDRLKPLLLDNIDAITAALKADFGHRSEDETKLAEILTSLEGIKYYRKRLRKWMKPQKRGVGTMGFPGSASVLYQPLGVVGVIVPWNYPLYLALGPLIAALAAGNRVMIKMSEFTPHIGELLAQLIAKTFAEDHVTVINGEMEMGAAFSKLPFDHLLFTGSTSVGRHIMRAAAENLTPVTLELGGKSPALISDDFPIKDAAERIAFGKCFNAGQTCVAPDYVLCPADKIDDFVEAFRQQVSSMYPTMLDNPDLTSVINERQHQRLRGYLQDVLEKGGRLVEINPANEDFQNSRKIPFTLILDSSSDMKITQEEIFGPLMIVQPYRNLDDAIHTINAGPRPLALYYFDWNTERANQVLTRTHSGGVCLNDTMSHVGIDDLPFGGVGDSGMGHYHGHEGFLTFSKAKAVFRKGRINPTRNILPPFGRGMHRFIYKFLLR